MTFQKRHIPWTKGKPAWNKGMILPTKGIHLSEETKRKISLANKGKCRSAESKFKNRLANLGKKLSEETKRKMSLAKKGFHPKCEFKKGHIVSEKHKQKLSLIMKQTRAKMILPKYDTSIEIKIQNYLKQLGISFFTHQYMKIKHGYQCDIYIPSKNMVIECDGIYWHKYPTGTEIDHIRTSELISKGFKVLRLWEYEIKTMNLEQFKERMEKMNQ